MSAAPRAKTPPAETPPARTLPAAALAEVMRACLARRGLSEEHAGFVVDGLVEASLRGIDTHGVRLFRTYLAELDGGRASARPEIRWAAGSDATRVLDAGGALGLVAGRLAAREVTALARRFGVGTVVVRNSNHFGPASCYTLEMARLGILGLCCTNSDALVAPWEGRRAFFGTNPLSAAVEAAGGDLFCADFATSQVAYSKVKRAREEGLPVEPGWALDAEGRDAAESAPHGGPPGGHGDAGPGALQPLGGYKGQCLGMLVEILSALLAGEPEDHRLSHLFCEPFDEPRRVAHFFLGLDVAAFTDPASFRERLAALLAETRVQPGRAGGRVRAPGDPEAEAAAERAASGIPLAPAEMEWFTAQAEAVGIPSHLS